MTFFVFVICAMAISAPCFPLQSMETVSFLLCSPFFRYFGIFAGNIRGFLHFSTSAFLHSHLLDFPFFWNVETGFLRLRLTVAALFPGISIIPSRFSFEKCVLHTSMTKDDESHRLPGQCISTEPEIAAFRSNLLHGKCRTYHSVYRVRLSIHCVVPRTQRTSSASHSMGPLSKAIGSMQNINRI